MHSGFWRGLCPGFCHDHGGLPVNATNDVAGECPFTWGAPMIRQLTLALVALAVALTARGESGPANAGPSAASPSSDTGVERHHYSISARVRPLLVFWISRSGVGDAVMTRRQGPSEAGYSLLIGSDPERAPRRINRWGYLDEEIRGGEATLIGLMTESDEDSLKQAEANIGRPVAGDRTYKIIRATIDGDRARSIVTSVAAPARYSFRHVYAVLELAQRESSEGQEGKARMMRLPAGTRPGFLTAIAELMHRHVDQWHASSRVQPGEPINYVYHGRIYELRATDTRPLARVEVRGAAYAHVIASDFETRSASDGEVDQFSITYGAEGPLAEIPLAVSYQPRWWLQVELALDDTTSGPALADGPNP
jgi:hypothetical protein